MPAEVSRACARVKNYLNLPPGPQLDSLIRSAETANSIDELSPWIKTTLRKMNDPVMQNRAA
jgi:hypothetical protein